MKLRIRHAAAAGLVAALGAPLLAAAPAGAISGDVDALALKTACETSLNNVVAMTDNVVVTGTAAIATKCTIVLPEQRVLEFIGANLTFGGPLVVNGAAQSQVSFTQDARVRARAMTLNLPGENSQVLVDHSQVGTTVGALRVTLGTTGALAVFSPTVHGNNVDAAGALAVTTGGQSQITLAEASLLSGPVTIAFNGAEGKLESAQSTISTRTATQSISINSTGAKAFVGLNGTTLVAGANVNLNLAGTESSIIAAQSSANAGGNVNVLASAATSLGSIEWVGAPASLSGLRVVFNASLSSQLGKVKLAQTTATASGTTTSDVLVRSGAFGITDVVDSTLSATRAVRVTSNPTSGSCFQLNNVVTAPIQQLCN
jgi:hypothetical protein